MHHKICVFLFITSLKGTHKIRTIYWLIFSACPFMEGSLLTICYWLTVWLIKPFKRHGKKVQNMILFCLYHFVWGHLGLLNDVYVMLPRSRQILHMRIRKSCRMVWHWDSYCWRVKRRQGCTLLTCTHHHYSHLSVWCVASVGGSHELNSRGQPHSKEGANASWKIDCFTIKV